MLDGGDHLIRDTCIVMAAGTTSNCERVITPTPLSVVPTRTADLVHLEADTVAAINGHPPAWVTGPVILGLYQLDGWSIFR